MWSEALESMIHDFVLSLLVFRACKKLPLWATTAVPPFSAVTIDCWSSFWRASICSLLNGDELEFTSACWWLKAVLPLPSLLLNCLASKGFPWMIQHVCFLGVAWPLAMITPGAVFLLWWSRLVSSCCHCWALNGWNWDGCSQHEVPPAFFHSYF